MQRMQAKEKYCRIYSLLYCTVFIKTNRMHSCLDPVLEAQREGLKVGDTSYATLCAVIYCNIAFRCKKKLSLVKKISIDLKKEAKVYKQDSVWNLALPLEQAIFNLMGRADKPSLLDCDAIPVENIDVRMAIAEGFKAERLLCATYYYWQMLVAYMFDDIELAIKMVEKYLDLKDPFEGLVVGSEIIFLYGLTSLAQARKTKEAIWKNRAHESLKKVKQLAKDSP
eukprot:15338584-Ditylum_brightwellii.AAC.1